MWALVSHLRDASTAHLTKNLLRHCRAELQDWLKAINYEEGHDFNLHPHVSPKNRPFTAVAAQYQDQY
jgi:hypothetical protein